MKKINIFILTLMTCVSICPRKRQEADLVPASDDDIKLDRILKALAPVGLDVNHVAITFLSLDPRKIGTNNSKVFNYLCKYTGLESEYMQFRSGFPGDKNEVRIEFLQKYLVPQLYGHVDLEMFLTRLLTSQGLSQIMNEFFDNKEGAIFKPLFNKFFELMGPDKKNAREICRILMNADRESKEDKSRRIHALLVDTTAAKYADEIIKTFMCIEFTCSITRLCDAIKRNIIPKIDLDSPKREMENFSGRKIADVLSQDLDFVYMPRNLKMSDLIVEFSAHTDSHIMIDLIIIYFTSHLWQEYDFTQRYESFMNCLFSKFESDTEVIQALRIANNYNPDYPLSLTKEEAGEKIFAELRKSPRSDEELFTLYNAIMSYMLCEPSLLALHHM